MPKSSKLEFGPHNVVVIWMLTVGQQLLLANASIDQIQPIRLDLQSGDHMVLHLINRYPRFEHLSLDKAPLFDGGTFLSLERTNMQRVVDSDLLDPVVRVNPHNDLVKLLRSIVVYHIVRHLVELGLVMKIERCA